MEIKYKTIFSSAIKPLVSEQKDKFLALASLVDIANFLPDINTTKNVDLLPIAFNACVANRVNKNGDVINTATAIEIYKNFINKPINIEHNRRNLIGVILTAGFSEFGSDLPLTEDQVKMKTDPFNITLGGLLWRIIDEKLTDLVEDSNDPTSENYLKVSASWELGFSDYDLVLIDGPSKNLENFKIVDEKDKEAFSKFLRSDGGPGKVSENEFIYRRVKTDVIPLGIGLTENPAAEVIGVAIKQEPVIKANADEKNISLSENSHVLKNSNKTMKINSIDDLKEDTMKEVSASEIRDFIKSELNKASEGYSALKAEKDGALKEAQSKIDSLSADHVSLEQQVETLEQSLEEMKKAEGLRKKEEAFSIRMAGMDEEYALTKEDKEILCSDIKALGEEEDSEAAFTNYKNKMAVLMKEKKKNTAKELTEKQKTLPPFIQEKILKSTETSASEIKEVIEEILDNKKNEVVEVPNTISTSNATLFERYKKAFDVDQFVITQ